jgi:hypothetical protein
MLFHYNKKKLICFYNKSQRHKIIQLKYAFTKENKNST